MSARVLLRTVVGVVAASAFVSIWGGWVGLGKLAGFGPVNLAPGIGDGLTVDLAITLPLGIEAYAAIALYVAVGGLVTGWARAFAWCSAIGSLSIGAFGQAAYHLLAADRVAAEGGTSAPTPIVIFVSVLPVAVLGLASVLLHLAERGMDAAAVPEPAEGDGTDGEGSDEGWAERGTEVPADGPWLPVDPAGDAFHAALAAPVPDLVPPTGTAPATLPQDRQTGGTAAGAALGEIQVDGDHDTAYELIRQGRAAGLPTSGTALSERHGMSERWWRDRLAAEREAAGR